jgi:pimeloyl-ACP methyl ester carboxylesterase
MKLEVPIDKGDGPPIVILHGYAMRPATYSGLAELLAQRCRVVVPDLFAVKGKWNYEEILDAFTETLDSLDIGRASLIGHSFGGGLELGFSARFPDRVVELVFSDTLADSREWGLAVEAARHINRLVWLATPKAISAFARNWVTHPRQLVDAALWAFASDRNRDSTAVAQADIISHVLWANRDSILSRPDGFRFAEELDATFTVAHARNHRAVDHDWMFEQPDLFVEHLDGLGLEAFA